MLFYGTSRRPRLSIARNFYRKSSAALARKSARRLATQGSQTAAFRLTLKLRSVRGFGGKMVLPSLVTKKAHPYDTHQNRICFSSHFYSGRVPAASARADRPTACSAFCHAGRVRPEETGYQFLRNREPTPFWRHLSPERPRICIRAMASS